MRRLARDLDGIALVVVAVLGLGLLSGSLLARPHILALPVLAVWAAGLFAARDGNRAPSLALLPLMTLWTNMHGSFVFGLALLGPFALEAVLAAPADRRIAAVRGWLVFGLLAPARRCSIRAASEALLFPVKLMGLKSLAGFGEWQPEAFDTLGPLEIDSLRFARLRAAIARSAWRRFGWPAGRPDPLALHHTRHAMILGLIAPMILARPIAEAVGCHRRPLRSPCRASSRPCSGALRRRRALRLAAPITREDGPTGADFRACGRSRRVAGKPGAESL